MSSPNSPRANQRAARRQARLAAEQRSRQSARRKRLALMVSAVLVVAVALVSILIVVTNENEEDDSTSPLANATAVYQGLTSQGMTLGNPNAPVTVVEYADYQCPYCKNFALQTEPQLIQDFVATGKVKYEFRPMPILSSLPLDNDGNESVQAAEAAMCATEQGKFWDFHHLLFTKQNGENVGIFSNANLISYATEGGLDVAAFTSCLDSGKYQQTVVDSREQGIADGVSGTPTFLINGTRVTLTTQGYDRLKQQIQDAIDGKPVS